MKWLLTFQNPRIASIFTRAKISFVEGSKVVNAPGLGRKEMLH